LGKYSHLKKILEKAPEDPTYQQKVNVVKDTLPTSLQELGAQYVSARELKDDFEEFEKDVNLEIEALTQKIVARLEEEGLTQIRLSDGNSISIKDDVYTQVQDKEQWLAFLRENDLLDLLSVHYGTMNSLVKERFETGQKCPPGLKAFIKSGLIKRRPPQ
jgi:hypothetical protein